MYIPVVAVGKEVSGSIFQAPKWGVQVILTNPHPCQGRRTTSSEGVVIHEKTLTLTSIRSHPSPRARGWISVPNEARSAGSALRGPWRGNMRVTSSWNHYGSGTWPLDDHEIH